MTPSPQLSAPRAVPVDRLEREPPVGSVPSNRLARRARAAGTPGLRASLFRDAQAIIQRDYGDDLSVEVLARRVLTSRRQLQRVFTDAGTTVRAELRAVRMQHAAELLLGSSLSIQEVASLVGYRPPAHFSSAFRRRYGVTPSQYRKRGVGGQADLQRRGSRRSDTAARPRPATSSASAWPDPPR